MAETEISVALAPGDDNAIILKNSGLFVPKVHLPDPAILEKTTITRTRRVDSQHGHDFLDSDWGSMLEIVSGGHLDISDERVILSAPNGAVFAACMSSGQGIAKVNRPGGDILLCAPGCRFTNDHTVALSQQGSYAFFYMAGDGTLIAVGTGDVRLGKDLPHGFDKDEAEPAEGGHENG